MVAVPVAGGVAGRATKEAKGEIHEVTEPEVIDAEEAFPLLDERHRRTWRGSELHALYVPALPLDTQDPSSFEPEVRLRMEEGARTRLEEEVRGIESSGGEVAGSHLALGRPDARIVEMAEGIGTGLIVMGGRGPGPVRQALIGSVSESVVRHAHCPVMVMRRAEGGVDLKP